SGAAGVILYMDVEGPLVSPGGLDVTDIPAVMISSKDGQALKNLLGTSPFFNVSIDPHGVETDISHSNRMSFFSSLGPVLGTSALKPDLVAIAGNGGHNIYMATQSFDPLGDMYSADGYVIADGTSFAAPMVAGAAALVKQKNPFFTTDQIRSALI